MAYYTLSSAASQAERTIPTELEELYRAEISRQYTSARRRNRLAFLSIAAICLFVGVCVVWANLSEPSGKNRPLEETIGRLERIVEEKRFEEMPEAIERIEKGPSKIAKHGQVVTLVEQIKYDQKRAQEFSQKYTQLEKDIANYRFAALKGLKSDLDVLQVLARELKKESEFRELDQKYNRALQREQNAFQHNAQAPGGSYSSQESGMRAMTSHSERPRQAPPEIVPDWSSYPAALKTLARDASGKDADTLLKAWESIERVAESLENFADDYTETAEQGFHAMQLNSSSLSEKYEKVAEPFDAIFSHAISSDDFTNLPTTARYSPEGFKSLKSFLEYLEKLTATTSEVYPWIDGNTGHWYYLTTKPDKPGVYGYITSPAGTEKEYRISNDKFASEKVPDQMVTPQYFAKWALGELGKTNDDNAQTTTRNVVEKLFYRTESEPGIDPILQCCIMDLLIKDVSEIDSSLTSRLSEASQILKDSEINDLVTWMDADDTDTPQHRTKAQETIEKLKTLDIPSLIEKACQDRKDFTAKLTGFRPRFKWAGCMIKKGEKWVCSPKPDTIDGQSGVLFTFTHDETNTTVSPIKIGTISSGQIKLELPDDDYASLQYSPVFLCSHRDGVAPGFRSTQ